MLEMTNATIATTSHGNLTINNLPSEVYHLLEEEVAIAAPKRCTGADDLSVLCLSPRVEKNIRSAGISTVQELARAAHNLHRVDWVSRKSVAEVREALYEHVKSL